MEKENRNISFDKVLENATKDNSTIIKSPGKINSLNNTEIIYLIINWKKNKLYSYDKISTSSGSLIAITEKVYSFFELIGVGIFVKSSESYTPYFKEYFSKFNTNKDGGIPFYETKRYSSGSFSEIESKYVTEIKFFLSYKEHNSKYVTYEYICIYNDMVDIPAKENIINQCETINTKLKRVLSVSDKKIYSDIVDKKLYFLESNISLGKKIQYLYDLFISNEIDLSKFIQVKSSIINTHTIINS